LEDFSSKEEKFEQWRYNYTLKALFFCWKMKNFNFFGNKLKNVFHRWTK